MANPLFPSGEQSGTVDLTFEDLVAEEVELLTQELLPRYVEAHHYGGGRYMLRRLLLDLDRDSFLEILQHVPSRKLTARARGRAERLVSFCRIETSDQLRVGMSGDILLGRYRRADAPSKKLMALPGRSQEEHVITLYRGSFEVSFGLEPVSPDQLRHEVLKVLVREHLHYLETQLLPRGADKRSGGDASFYVARFTLAEARRQDLFQLILRGARYALMGGVGVLCFWLALWVMTGA